MKISTFFFSFCGFCIFYICNADWIDELIEDYLGTDYEEVAPFISSVTAGTEEFDQLVEELSRSKWRWWVPSPLLLASALCAVALTVLWYCQILRLSKGRRLVKFCLEFLGEIRKSGTNKEEIQSIVAEFLERKMKQLNKNKDVEDVPVKLLWKGGSLMESSVHCNIRDESTLHQLQKRLLQTKLFSKPKDGAGDESVSPTFSSSESSTARKMSEIRKLLESEQELPSFRERGAGASEKMDGCCKPNGPSVRKVPERPSSRLRTLKNGADHQRRPESRKRLEVLEHPTDQSRKDELEGDRDYERNGSQDPKLMNRIRLLESRLRLEELKNKNWISRMSRAEGILQQLNKQVEQIEETRPLGTLTETLKITSTVTNWTPSSHPRRNMQFTLVNQYPPFCMRAPYTSLSELIQREVGLPSTGDYSKTLPQLPPTPQIPQLHYPPIVPQSSILSKFLCR